MPAGRGAEAAAIAEEIGFPVLIRPSYVLGGRAMEIVYDQEELASYMAAAVQVSSDRPVLVEKYLVGREVEVDAVSDGETVVVAGIMEARRAGRGSLGRGAMDFGRLVLWPRSPERTKRKTIPCHGNEPQFIPWRCSQLASNIPSIRPMRTTYEHSVTTL